MIAYKDFAEVVESFGLTPRECSYHHWQILGGRHYKMVNVWPHSKKGFGMAAGTGKGQSGSIEEAIRLAGPKRCEPTEPWVPPILSIIPPETVAPWEEPPTRHGLIRTVALFIWRWLW